jgi:hypothetical protein
MFYWNYARVRGAMDNAADYGTGVSRFGFWRIRPFLAINNLIILMRVLFHNTFSGV